MYKEERRPSFDVALTGPFQKALCYHLQLCPNTFVEWPLRQLKAHNDRGPLASKHLARTSPEDKLSTFLSSSTAFQPSRAL